MHLENFNYIKSQTINEACSILAEYGEKAKVLAGGSDLLVALKQKRLKPEAVIDIRGIPELGDLKFEDDVLRIGSLVTLDRIADNEKIQKRFSVLSEAAFSVGAVQHQTMGTVGGNICLETRCWWLNQASSWRKSRAVCTKLGGDVCHVVNKGGGLCFAAFSADLATGLVAMDAKVVLTSSTGDRVLPLEEFYTGNGVRPNVLGPNEIVREVIIEASPYEVKSTYLKRRVRQSIDFAQAGAAVTLWMDKQDIKKARIVLNAVGSGPIRVQQAEELLVGKKVDEQVIVELKKIVTSAAKPANNVHGASVNYRKQAAGVLAGEGIGSLLGLNPNKY